MAMHKNYRKLKEYPKLTGGGGFECLRASDLCGNVLLSIDIPHHGYNVKYLLAVMKSDKIHIRPLQRDLDDKPFLGGGGLSHFLPKFAHFFLYLS